MELSPMRYKGYTWPHNPQVYTIDFERKMALHKIPFGLYRLQDVGRTCRVMEGMGEFAGEDAYPEFARLANVFYENGPGLLIHPLWVPASAYFVSLRLEQEPRPDYVRYSFAFWEDYDQHSGLAKQTAERAGSGGAAAGADGGGKAVHRVVKGDTLWAIARTYGISLEELIALNPQIKNPNLIRVGDEVRVK